MLAQIKTKSYSWLLVKKPKSQDIENLRAAYKLVDEDLINALPPVQRAQFIARDKYNLLVLQFPYYSKQAHEILHSEVDFFIGRNFLITITDGELPPLLEAFHASEAIESALPKDPVDLMLELIEDMINYLSPMLNHIAEDIDNIEHKILDDSPAQRETIYSLLSLKSNAVNFRRIIRENEHALKKFASKGGLQIKSSDHKSKLETLSVLSGEVDNTLETYKETIDALDETHESLLNFRANNVMKTLTIFAVIVFPLTLLAAIFGMNFVDMPFTDLKGGFWIVIGIMLIGALSLWRYFKHKHWL